MKKVLTLIVMAVAMAMPSQAQTQFGLKGGLNLTKMTVNNSNVEDMFKNKAGFFIGPTVKFTLPIVGLGIDAAALYDQREADFEVDNM
ncbi:MAG: outer membrane beta-barrel protein, partial [Prevotella sp.]|nr:outer membrane beta-barrel protein [Prevotella sp.]